MFTKYSARGAGPHPSNICFIFSSQCRIDISREDLLIPTSARLRGPGSCNLKPDHCYPLHGNKAHKRAKMGAPCMPPSVPYGFQNHNFLYTSEWVGGGGRVPHGDGCSLRKHSGGRASLRAQCALAPTWCARARLMTPAGDWARVAQGRPSSSYRSGSGPAWCHPAGEFKSLQVTCPDQAWRQSKWEKDAKVKMLHLHQWADLTMDKI